LEKFVSLSRCHLRFLHHSSIHPSKPNITFTIVKKLRHLCCFFFRYCSRQSLFAFQEENVQEIVASALFSVPSYVLLDTKTALNSMSKKNERRLLHTRQKKSL
jgi:hypothetical protein